MQLTVRTVVVSQGDFPESVKKQGSCQDVYFVINSDA